MSKIKINDTEKPDAAACPKCGGWSEFGGMSPHRNHGFAVLGRTGCYCNRQPITGGGFKLVDDFTGLPVHVDEVRKDYRGDLIVIKGGRPPHKPTSSGHVYVTDFGAEDTAFPSEYYASVTGASWVPAASVLPEQEKAAVCQPMDLPELYVGVLKASYLKQCANPNLPASGHVRVIDELDGVIYFETGNTLWKAPNTSFK